MRSSDLIDVCAPACVRVGGGWWTGRGLALRLEGLPPPTAGPSAAVSNHQLDPLARVCYRLLGSLDDQIGYRFRLGHEHRVTSRDLDHRRSRTL